MINEIFTSLELCCFNIVPLCQYFFSERLEVQKMLVRSGASGKSDKLSIIAYIWSFWNLSQRCRRSGQEIIAFPWKIFCEPKGQKFASQPSWGPCMDQGPLVWISVGPSGDPLMIWLDFRDLGSYSAPKLWVYIWFALFHRPSCWIFLRCLASGG